MDEFLNWILECYANGELTNEEVERALIDEYFAYELFLDSWKCDWPSTGKMAQESFKQAKHLIENMKHDKRK